MQEFGTKRENEERRDGGCAVVFDPEKQLFAVYENTKNGLLGLFGGGVEENEDEKDGVLRELTEESGLVNFLHIEKIDKVLVHYFNNNKNINRISSALCLLVVLGDARTIDTKLEDHEKFKIVWTNSEKILENWNSRNNEKDYDHWVYFLEKSIKRLEDLGYKT